jgi:Skp family chaperone for outer membrane proteins
VDKYEDVWKNTAKEIAKKRDQYKNERDTLIDDVAILKANNDRLMRRNQKLQSYVRMWEKLTKWKQRKLAERCNNDLLHELSYTMNELERDMYKERG